VVGRYDPYTSGFLEFLRPPLLFQCPQEGLHNRDTVPTHEQSAADLNPPARCLGHHRCVQPTVDLTAPDFPERRLATDGPLRSGFCRSTSRKGPRPLGLGRRCGVLPRSKSETVVNPHRGPSSRRRTRGCGTGRDPRLSPENGDSSLRPLRAAQVAWATCTRGIFGNAVLAWRAQLHQMGTLLRPDPAQTQAPGRDSATTSTGPAFTEGPPRRLGGLGEVAGLETQARCRPSKKASGPGTPPRRPAPTAIP